MSDTPRLTSAELRERVDPDELVKGAQTWSAGVLTRLARHGSKLFAEAEGSGAAPYRVQVTIKADAVASRCTCPAAFSRPVCRHGAALLVAWAQAPDGFAVADGPPEDASAKKRAPAKGVVDVAAGMSAGVQRLEALAVELASTGVTGASEERAAQVRELGRGLREARLRRPAGRVAALASMLEGAAEGVEIDPVAWVDALAGALLMARRIARHLAGDVLDEKYFEALIGKTWTKKDRAPVADLRLVEVAWRTATTDDDFRIAESRFVDLRFGEAASEKQIIPGFLAKRTPAKRSWRGLVVTGAGSMFPGFPPRRLDLDAVATAPLTSADLEPLVAAALPRVADALVKLQERRRDPFGPDDAPVCVRVDRLLSRGGRLHLVDDAGDALFLPLDPGLVERIVDGLGHDRPEVLIGDLAVDGALPVIEPLAFVTRGVGGLRLVSVGGASGWAQKGLQATPERARPAVPWTDTARAAGVSQAAVSVGEVREELARVVSTGWGALTRRGVEPAAARLRDLGLGRVGDLLLGVPELADPVARFEAVVRVNQALSVALVKLCGAVVADRDAMRPVPGHPGVFVVGFGEPRPPAAVAQAVAAGAVDALEAQVAYAAHWATVPAATLRDPRTWTDASATAAIVAAFGERDEGARVAGSVLAGRGPRIGRLIAAEVLAGLGGDAAIAQLQRALGPQRPGVVERRVLAALARSGVAVARGSAPPLGAIREVVDAGSADVRTKAAKHLAEAGDLDAASALRRALVADPNGLVRAAAARALGALADLASVERLVAATRDAEAAVRRAAFDALGEIGDVRALQVVIDGGGIGPLAGFGVVGADAVITLALANPKLAKSPGYRAFVVENAEAFAAAAAARFAAPTDAAVGVWLDLTSGRAAASVRAARPDLAADGDGPKKLKARVRKALAGEDGPD